MTQTDKEATFVGAVLCGLWIAAGGVWAIASHSWIPLAGMLLMLIGAAAFMAFIGWLFWLAGKIFPRG